MKASSSGHVNVRAAVCAVLLGLMACACAQADPSSTVSVSHALTTRASQPPKCPIGTNVGQPGSCLLDEGWSNDCSSPSSCKDAGLGPNVHPLRPVASALRISVSSTTVAVGSSITVRASVAAPRCTYAMVNAQKRCWNNIQFGDRRQYLPANYSSLYNPPLVAYDHACAGLPYYYPYKSTSCAGKIIWNYGPRKIAPGHLMVITVNDDILGPGGYEELDYAEVALRFGPPPKKCGTPGGASCPLKVLVSVLEPIRSGLARDTNDPSEGSVNFTVPSYSASGSVYGEAGEASQKCMSGCANLLVSVIDPKRHKPVKGANVTVSVDPVDFVKGGGHEFLCTNSDPTKLRCGATALSGLTTDANGQLHLIYWAPSVIQVEKTTLTVNARAPSYPRPGTATTQLTINPNVIYDKLGTFSAAEVTSLIGAARANPLLTMSHFLEEPFKGVLDSGFTWLAGDEELAEAAFGGAAEALTIPLFLAVEAVDLGKEALEQIKLIDVFLEQFDLPAIGLERPGHEAKGRTAGSRAPSPMRSSTACGFQAHPSPGGSSGASPSTSATPCLLPTHASSLFNSRSTRSPTATRPMPAIAARGSAPPTASIPNSASCSQPTTSPRISSTSFASANTIRSLLSKASTTSTTSSDKAVKRAAPSLKGGGGTTSGGEESSHVMSRCFFDNYPGQPGKRMRAHLLKDLLNASLHDARSYDVEEDSLLAENSTTARSTATRTTRGRHPRSSCRAKASPAAHHRPGTPSRATRPQR